MGKAISGMVVFTLLAKVLGFVRELLLSFFLERLEYRMRI